MTITIAQLLLGFKKAMTIRELAEQLGVSETDVRARIRALTSDEEHEINQAMAVASEEKKETS